MSRLFCAIFEKEAKKGLNPSEGVSYTDTSNRKGGPCLNEERLRIEKISQKYQAENGEVEALEEISFTVDDGEFISIVGPSGCGKSTLLSIVAGLDRPTGGAVYLDGEKVTGISPRIGYMLQKDQLLPWRTIWKNVTLGLEIRHELTPENLEYTRHLLDSYGLLEFQEKYPAQLSGGMRQRAALIRTLAVRPQILLLDEAFSALDYQTRLAVTDDVYRILKNEHMTTLMVTHDIPESISMADRLVVLTKRPGRIKSIHRLEFAGEAQEPLSRRDSPEFSHYFNLVWKELDVHV